MLQRFVSSVTPIRDWAGYWEIDKAGEASPADYLTDEDFWYNLPANFDLLDASFRMWLWTGDSSFVTEPRFKSFFQETSTDYVSRWQLGPDEVLSRPRIMNRRLQKGKFVEARGIPSYTEGRSNFNVGTDLLAAEFRAFEDLSFLASAQEHELQSRSYAATARKLLNLIETRGWSESDQHFAGSLADDGTQKDGDGDAMVLYFGAVRNPRHLRGALSWISRPEFRRDIGIEEESYLPQILYHYDRAQAAYDTILNLTRSDKERRTYPEVSYAVVAAIVTGAMGVEVAYDRSSLSFEVGSLDRLADPVAEARIAHLHVQQNDVELEHRGQSASSITNVSGPPLLWKAEFYGRTNVLDVEGEKRRARVTRDSAGEPVSFVVIRVLPGMHITVKRPQALQP
ncbi:hypothetical protein [Bryocella elongata]|nr:hypothetical protein [Bryocella elongata]